MPLFSFRSLVCVLFIAVAYADDELYQEGRCPVDPGSESCRFDCSAEVFDIICVGNANYTSVRSDVNTLATTGRFLDVYLWNLNATGITIEASIFGKAQKKIRRLSLMTLDLLMFPQLRGLTFLYSLTVVSAPNLTDLPFESLPEGLVKLEIYDTGISRLENDFEERKELESLHDFTLKGSEIQYIQSEIFTAFTGLNKLFMRDNTFRLTGDIQDGMFKTAKPLAEFIFTNNSFASSKKEVNALFFKKLLESLVVDSNSVVDLSNNRLPVVFDNLAAIKRLKQVRALFLQGNPFENSLTITGLFEDFHNLRELDLSNTNLPISRGTFRGLPSLDILRIGGNNFADMTAVDMFAESRSSMLRVLDLSHNSLTALPEGDLERVADMLEDLDLTGNILLPIEFPINTVILNGSYSRPTFSSFPELRFLGLSGNNWTQFDGRLLVPLQNLKSLDLSCNFFWVVTQDFFNNMPQGIQSINLTFCFDVDAEPPVIQEGAFKRMPPVRTLVLAKGSLRNWIFDRLREIPANTLNTLENLLLNENNIAFLGPDMLTGFSNIKSLSLHRNTLQSLGNSSFKHMTGLKKLIVSNNQLVSIDLNDLNGLDNLEFLDLQNNRIAHIESGALDKLSSLKSLYLGGNLLIGLDDVWVNGGASLIHLGLQGNPIECIRRSDLDPLVNLKWLYMFNLTTPIFFHRATDSGILREKIYSEPWNSQDALYCDNRVPAPDLTMPPMFMNLQEKRWQQDFLRLYLTNPWDLSPRHFIGHIPKCYIPEARNLSRITANLLCPMGDKKTWQGSDDDKGPKGGGGGRRGGAAAED